MPIGLKMAHFIRVYGYNTFHNEQYPTRDHNIPRELFFLLFEATRSITALDRVMMTRAVMLGQAMANGAGDKAERLINEDIKEVYGEQ